MHYGQHLHQSSKKNKKQSTSPNFGMSPETHVFFGLPYKMLRLRNISRTFNKSDLYSVEPVLFVGHLFWWSICVM